LDIRLWSDGNRSNHTALPMNLRLLIAVLTAIQFTYLVDFVMMMPLGPRLMHDLNCSPAQFSHLVAAYTISSGVAAALAGTVLGRFDRRHALLVLYGGMTVATLACGLANSYGTLLAARIAAGGCGGLVGSLIFAIIGERIPYERRAAASGIVMSAFSLASVIGIPIGIGLAQLGRWETPFLALSGLGAVVWLVALKYLPRMDEHRHSERRPLLNTLRLVFGDARHWRAYLLTISLTMSGFTVIPLLASTLVKNAGLPEAHVAWFYGIGGLVTLVTGPLIGRLADRFGKRVVFLSIAGASIAPILICTHLGRVGEGLAILYAVVFVVLVSGRFVPAMAMITQVANPAVRGAFQAYNTAVQSLSSGVATVLAGALVTSGPNGTLVGYGTVGWIAVVATGFAMIAGWRLSHLAEAQTSVVEQATPRETPVVALATPDP
jgi:predicted MFS family arabinose efflux permease